MKMSARKSFHRVITMPAAQAHLDPTSALARQVTMAMGRNVMVSSSSPRGFAVGTNFNVFELKSLRYIGSALEALQTTSTFSEHLHSIAC